jgi:hypothetical protein
MQAVESRAAPRRMTLDAVTKGKVARPQRIVIFGTEGIGKSTFAADAPDVIFIPTEDGTEHLDVARFPIVRSWRDMLDALDALRAAHSFRTVAIDTLDAFEPHVWSQTCATKSNSGKKVEHIEDYGFAKGYDYALDVWRTFLDRLDQLRDERGMSVIVIAHSQVSTFKSPDTEDFHRYELKVHKKASALVKEWADHVLFTTHEILTHKQNNRAKGISTGNRLIYTTKTAAYDAKHRGSLPDSLPLSWDAFARALEGDTGEPPEAWRTRIAKMLERADDALRERVNKAVSAASDDVAKLATIANRLSVMTQQKESA